MTYSIGLPPLFAHFLSYSLESEFFISRLLSISAVVFLLLYFISIIVHEDLLTIVVLSHRLSSDVFLFKELPSIIPLPPSK